MSERKQMAYQLEITDTFGGEANYSWVHWKYFEASPQASRRALVRRAKAVAGWTNVPCVVDEYGDLISIKPRGAAMVAFVTWSENYHGE